MMLPCYLLCSAFSYSIFYYFKNIWCKKESIIQLQPCQSSMLINQLRILLRLLILLDLILCVFLPRSSKLFIICLRYFFTSSKWVAFDFISYFKEASFFSTILLFVLRDMIFYLGLESALVTLFVVVFVVVLLLSPIFSFSYAYQFQILLVLNFILHRLSIIFSWSLSFFTLLLRLSLSTVFLFSSSRHSPILFLLCSQIFDILFLVFSILFLTSPIFPFISCIFASLCLIFYLRTMILSFRTGILSLITSSLMMPPSIFINYKSSFSYFASLYCIRRASRLELLDSNSEDMVASSVSRTGSFQLIIVIVNVTVIVINQRFKHYRVPKIQPFEMRPNRVYSQKSQSSELNKSHIVQAHLDRKSQLINKYQTETNDLMEQIQTKQPYRKAPILNVDKSARKRATSSLRKDTSELDAQAGIGGSLKDYNKLILGLQYALESERKKNQEMVQKNLSLQSQISNLRNLLMGPDEQKHYQKTAYKESQDKITYLENRVIEQKKNYQFIIDSKNETLTNLELQIKTLKKSFDDKTSNNDQALSRRVLDLIGQMDQLKQMLTKKNIIIQRLKYQNIPDEDSDDEQITKIRKAERMKFYLQQLQISNKLIMRKNVEILSLSNKIMTYEKIMDVIELYLDKKEVRGVDLSILEHPCVNKLRILLREKAVFEKQLLNQLNDHNKKIATFENEINGRERTSTEKIAEVINDNKRLAGTVTNLQSNIANLQKQLEISRRQNEMLTTQITINKREFIQEVTKLKDELGQISSVTKNQFDRMKIQNLKLSEQNRSLLFLVGQKQRQIHKKGQAIKTFQQYRQKINTLNVADKDKRKIEAVSQQNTQQIGTKVLMINNFSNWLFEWNKIKNWANKKTLLNLILDKEEIRGTALDSMGYLINVIQECLLQSKNVQIQERGTILLSYFVQHNILKNQNLYLGKITPIIVRGFRPIIQGQDESKCRLLNESTLKILTALSKTEFKWSYEMTNQMLAVNGLKYLFNTIRKAQVDDLIQSAYNVLILIARNNEMISFMMSFDLNTLIYSNLNSEYTFIIFLLTLVKHLLQGNDYLKAQSSVLEYRKIFDILASDDDQDLLGLGLECLLILMDKNSIFTKSLEKIKSISILSQILRKSNDEANQSLLKHAGKVYINIVTELESQNINKYTKTELEKLLQVIKLKKFNEFRFSRIIKVLAIIVSIIQGHEQLDDKIFLAVVKLYEHYEVIQQDIRIKMNEIINIIFERNKELLNKYSNDTMISQFVEAYKLSSHQEELLFLLKILIFQAEQKRTTELLRSGRESMLSKMVNDALLADYNVAISALKLLLLLSKEKYNEKFINQSIMNNIIKKVLNQRGEEEYIGITLSLLYFLCKVESIVAMALEAGIVAKICNVITERHDKEQIIFKALAVLEVCHSMNYKKKVLNYMIASDNNLQILKTLNFSLRKAKNKVEMGTRAVFIYDFFNNPTSVESLAILAERNQWLVEDLIMLRNEYLGKVQGIVYKIEMLLHEMSLKSNKVKKLYQKYKVDGGQSEEDD